MHEWKSGFRNGQIQKNKITMDFDNEGKVHHSIPIYVDFKGTGFHFGRILSGGVFFGMI